MPIWRSLLATQARSHHQTCAAQFTYPSRRWAGCAGTAAWCRTCCRCSTLQPSERRFQRRRRWTDPLCHCLCLTGHLWGTNTTKSAGVRGFRTEIPFNRKSSLRRTWVVVPDVSTAQHFSEPHLHVCSAFKWAVSSVRRSPRTCGGAAGAGGGGAAGGWWPLISCSDRRVLWGLLRGKASSRHRAARPAMWVICCCTYTWKENRNQSADCFCCCLLTF